MPERFTPKQYRDEAAQVLTLAQSPLTAAQAWHTEAWAAMLRQAAEDAERLEGYDAMERAETMTDAEIEAELRAEGIDPVVAAEQTKALLRKSLREWADPDAVKIAERLADAEARLAAREDVLNETAARLRDSEARLAAMTESRDSERARCQATYAAQAASAEEIAGVYDALAASAFTLGWDACLGSDAPTALVDYATGIAKARALAAIRPALGAAKLELTRRYCDRCQRIRIWVTPNRCGECGWPETPAPAALGERACGASLSDIYCGCLCGPMSSPWRCNLLKGHVGDHAMAPPAPALSAQVQRLEAALAMLVDESGFIVRSREPSRFDLARDAAIAALRATASEPERQAATSTDRARAEALIDAVLSISVEQETGSLFTAKRLARELRSLLSAPTAPTVQSELERLKDTPGLFTDPAPTETE